MIKTKVLCVDDEPQVIQGLALHLHRDFEVVPALSGAAGLQALEHHGPFAVVLSDMRMPAMDGAAFLAQVRERWPDTVRMLLTGHADLHAAIAAVNEGQIFRFLTKPCPPDQLRLAFLAATEQHRLVTAERELLEKTLSGSIKLMSELLAMASPVAYGRTARVRRLVKLIAAQMQVNPAWLFELAAMLSQIGCVAVPDKILRRAITGEPLSPAEQEQYYAHTRLGQSLLANIPRLADVIDIVAYQHKDFDGGGYPPDDLRGDALPLGARVLHLALGYDTLVMSGRRGQIALFELKRQANRYDPVAFNVLQEIIEREAGYAVRMLAVEELEDGMITAEDVFDPNDVLLCSRGLEVTPSLKALLLGHVQAGLAKRDIKVQIPLRR